MKTLETLYQEVLASDELKKGLAEAAKAPEGLEAWICAQGCEATAEEIGAFLKEKQAKTGELSDDDWRAPQGEAATRARSLCPCTLLSCVPWMPSCRQ